MNPTVKIISAKQRATLFGHRANWFRLVQALVGQTTDEIPNEFLQYFIRMGLCRVRYVRKS